MMIVYINIILLLLGTITLYTTCRKDSPTVCEDKNTIKVAQHARDYFYFKQGSWWVYEEETTKEKDSIWVQSTTEKTYVPEGGIQRSCNCGWGKCEEQLGVTFVNINHNKLTKDYLFGYGIRSSIVDESTTIRTGGGGYFFSTNTYRLEYNPDGTPKTPLPFKGSMQTLDSVEVKGKNYKDILRIYYTEGNGKGDWLQDGYFARGIHLIKFKKSDNTAWNLIKYNIVK